MVGTEQLDRQTPTQTSFSLLVPESLLGDGTALVECRPHGGQRHQIRAHLAAVGWPVANDELYGGHRVDGEQGGEWGEQGGEWGEQGGEWGEQGGEWGEQGGERGEQGGERAGEQGGERAGEQGGERAGERAGKREGAALAGRTALRADHIARYAYTDDDRGTLRRLLTAPQNFRPWCAKCKWTSRLLQSPKSAAERQGEANPHVDDGLRRIEVQRGGIWLHSMRYVLPAAGVDVKAPLPAWAALAKDCVAARFAQDDATVAALVAGAREYEKLAEAGRVAEEAAKATKAAQHVPRGQWREKCVVSRAPAQL